jgi:hypothetical protein
MLRFLSKRTTSDLIDRIVQSKAKCKGGTGKRECLPAPVLTGQFAGISRRTTS